MRLLRQLWDALFGEDETRKIRENLWILISVMNNPTMTVFKRGSAFTVTDPGVELLWPRRRRALRKLMASQSVTRVETVIPTHAHPDHIGALEKLLLEFGPIENVLVHRSDLWMVKEPQTLARRMERMMNQAGDHFRPWILRLLYPLYGFLSLVWYGSGAKPWSRYRHRRTTLVIIKNGTNLVLEFTGYRLHVFHNPGHCPGELAMRVENFDSEELSIVICGDIVINDERGRNYYPSAYLPDGHIPDVLESLDRLRKLEPDVLIVTHSEPLMGRELIRRTLSHTREVTSAVAITAEFLRSKHPEWTLAKLAEETFREFGMNNCPNLGVNERKSWLRPIYLHNR